MLIYLFQRFGVTRGMYSQEDTSASTIVWVSEHNTVAMATGHNIDWHSNNKDKLYNDSNLIACDYLHAPALFDGNLTFVRQKHCTGVSLNECEVIDSNNIIINWEPTPLANVGLFNTPQFKTKLLHCMYRSLNSLENEIRILKDEIEENKHNNDNQVSQMTQNSKVW